VSAVFLSQSVFPSHVVASFQDRASTHPDPAPSSTFDPAQLTIPERFGRLSESFSPESGATRLVIHLQDVHTQYDTQKALAALIGHLRRATKVSLVALEGGSGPGDTEFFSDFPDQETNKQLADLFLKKGLFTGPIYYAVTHPGEVNLYGAENTSAYLDHLKTYQVAHPKQVEAARYVETLAEVLKELQAQLSSKDIKTFTVNAAAYEADQLSFTKYVKYLQDLATRYEISLEPYPNLTRLDQIARLEAQIDLKAVEQEHRQLLEALSQRLAKPELQALLKHQLAFKAGKVSQAQYYEGLRRFGQQAEIPLTPPTASTDHPAVQTAKAVSKTFLGLPTTGLYAHLIAYTELQLLSKDLRHDQLADELDHLVGAMKTRLLTTPEQQRVDQLVTTLDVLRDLYNVRLSKERLEYYHRQKADFAAQPFVTFLDEQHRLTPALRQAITALFDDLSGQEQFYTIAFERDEALVTNTLREMDREGQSVAILVTGGFHTHGMTQLLKDQGVAYAVVTPMVSGDTDEALYSSLLLNQVPSIEQLIQELSKNLASGQLDGRLESTSLVPEQGIFPSSDQVNVQTDPSAVGRTDVDQPAGQSKRSYLRETWTYLNTVALSVKGWTADRIQTAYAKHPTLEKVLPGVTIQANGSKQVAVTINGTALTYEPRGRSVRVVSVEHEPSRKAVQVASVESGTNQTLPVGAGSVAPMPVTSDAPGTEPTPGSDAQDPAMRWSGKGLTLAEHQVINEALSGYYTDPAKSSQRHLLDVDSEEYRNLDPDGVLRASGVRIYVFEGLIQTATELAVSRGIEPPTDLVTHPGRTRGNLYVDADTLPILLARDETWRRAWAAHELAHIQHPDEDEVAVQARVPLPSVPGVTAFAAFGGQPGEFFRHQREQANLNQREVADRLKISPAEWSHLERGTRLPSYPITIAVGKALGFDGDQFWQEIVEPLKQQEAAGKVGLEVAEATAPSETPGAFIRWHREAKQISAQGLSGQLGLDRTYVGKFEQEWMLPNHEHAIALGKALDFDGEAFWRDYVLPTKAAKKHENLERRVARAREAVTPSAVPATEQLQPGETPGQFIRRLREQKGWSQKELAEQANVAVPSISPIESGTNLPSYEVAVALGKALGFDGDALMEQHVRPLKEAHAGEALDARRARVEGIEPPTGSTMRWSGQGLTPAQHDVVNTVVTTYFQDPAKAAQRRLLDVDSAEYRALDPTGLLRSNGVRIYVFDGLIPAVTELAIQRNVPPPTDLVTHPGRARGNLYLDAKTLPIVLARDEAWRTAWAAHEWAHIQYPDEDEASVQGRAVLPTLPWVARVSEFGQRPGDFIRQRRERANLAQNDVATRVNVSAGHLSKLEQGTRLPDYTTAVALGRALDFDGEQWWREVVEPLKKQAAEQKLGPGIVEAPTAPAEAPGAFLRRYREAKQLSANETGRRLNAKLGFKSGDTYVGKLETGVVLPTHRLAIALGEILDFDGEVFWRDYVVPARTQIEHEKIERRVARAKEAVVPVTVPPTEQPLPIDDFGGRETPGQFIRRLREQKGWTQKELADRVNIVVSYVSPLERDEQLPGYEVAVALGKVLGFDGDAFMEQYVRPLRQQATGEALEAQRARVQEIEPSTDPSMRWSGQGLTPAQHEVVNAAIQEHFPAPFQLSQGVQLDPNSDEYKALDPQGALRARGIRIYVLDKLIQRSIELALQRGIEPPADLVTHPSRARGQLYLDAETLPILLARDEMWRAAWAAHELAHVEHPDEDEAAIQARAPLPTIAVASVPAEAPQPEPLTEVPAPAPPAEEVAVEEPAVREAEEPLAPVVAARDPIEELLHAYPEQVKTRATIRGWIKDYELTPEEIGEVLFLIDNFPLSIPAGDTAPEGRLRVHYMTFPQMMRIYEAADNDSETVQNLMSLVSEASLSSRRPLWVRFYMLEEAAVVWQQTRSLDRVEARLERFGPPYRETAEEQKDKEDREEDDEDPAMRWSGQGLTPGQHEVLNTAIQEHFPAPFQVTEGQQLDPDSTEYKALDPEGLLRANGVRIYLLDKLIHRTIELGLQRGVEPPADLVTHPGRTRSQLYLDSDTLPILLGRDESWRAAWARHELAHIEHPEENEAAVQARVRLPLSWVPLTAAPAAPGKAAGPWTQERILETILENVWSVGSLKINDWSVKGYGGLVQAAQTNERGFGSWQSTVGAVEKAAAERGTRLPEPPQAVRRRVVPFGGWTKESIVETILANIDEVGALTSRAWITAGYSGLVEASLSEKTFSGWTEAANAARAEATTRGIKLPETVSAVQKTRRKTPWTTEDIVDTILENIDRVGTSSEDVWQREVSGVVQAAYRDPTLGSWRAAVEAARQAAKGRGIAWPEKTSGRGGPAMRWSGEGLTAQQHQVVNDAIQEYFTDAEKASQLKLLDPSTSEYQHLDPQGILRNEGIRIYLMPGLIQRIDQLAQERGLEAPTDLVTHPGRTRGQLYLDPVAYSQVTEKDEAWRVAWARHELEHIQNTEADEATVQARAPLPGGTVAATPFTAVGPLVRAVAEADPILARFESVVRSALNHYASGGRRPLIYLVGSEALKTATGLATLVKLREQITASDTTKLINIVYVHTDPAVSQADLFKAAQVDADALFDFTASATNQLSPSLLKTRIVLAVNQNLDEYRGRTGQTLDALPPIEDLSRSNTVTLASNAQPPVPVEQRGREQQIFHDLVTDAVHVLVAQPDSTDEKAVADYSRAVTSTLVALSESPDVPTDMKEDIEAVKQAIAEGGEMTIPPRPSSALHDVDQQFKAKRQTSTKA